MEELRAKNKADQNIVGPMLFSINYDLTVLLKNRLALYHIDLVFLHQSGNPIAHLVHYPILMGMGLGKVEAQSVHTHPKDRAVLGW